MLTILCSNSAWMLRDASCASAPPAPAPGLLPLATYMDSALYIALPALAFGAGLVDAIAGGGGLLTLPALLAAGLPPHVALGTNKGQAVFGSGSALWAFVRARRVDLRRAPPDFVAGFVGSLSGAALVSQLDPARLKPLILVLLVCAAIAVTTLRPGQTGQAERPLQSPRARLLLGLGIAAAVGMYDGFFGPGTGTFLIVLYAWLLRDPLVEASANAKVVNFATNLAAVLLFGFQGAIVWPLALGMGIAQLAGAQVGARIAVRGGQRVVRAVALSVTAALVLKIGWDLVG